MMKPIKSILLVLSVLFVLFVVGCSGGEEPTADDAGDEELPAELAVEGETAIAGQAIKRGSVTYISCDDSDAGNNPYIPGYTTRVYENNGKLLSYDQPDGFANKKLYERTCKQVCIKDKEGVEQCAGLASFQTKTCSEYVSTKLLMKGQNVEKTAWACKCIQNAECGDGYACNGEGICVDKQEASADFQSCVDSDAIGSSDGYDNDAYMIASNATWSKGGINPVSNAVSFDSCLNGQLLNESLCLGDTWESEVINCTYNIPGSICVDGACVIPEPDPKADCPVGQPVVGEGAQQCTTDKYGVAYYANLVYSWNSTSGTCDKVPAKTSWGAFKDAEWCGGIKGTCMDGKGCCTLKEVSRTCDGINSVLVKLNSCTAAEETSIDDCSTLSGSNGTSTCFATVGSCKFCGNSICAQSADFSSSSSSSTWAYWQGDVCPSWSPYKVGVVDGPGCPASS